MAKDIMIHGYFVLRGYKNLALLHFRTPLYFAIDDSSWSNVAESFTVALTLTLGTRGVRKCFFGVLEQ